MPSVVVPRTGKVALGIVAAVFGLVACSYLVVWNALTWNPPQNEEAKHRERVLRTMPGQDLSAAGLHLVSTYSSAGRHAGNGDFQLGHDVMAGRLWSFTGDIAATCHAAAERILAAGWAYEFEAGSSCDDVEHVRADPDLDIGAHDYVVVLLIYDCAEFTVRGTLHLTVDAERDPARSLSFNLSTAYPEGHQPARPSEYGSTTTVAPAPLLDCIP